MNIKQKIYCTYWAVAVLICIVIIISITQFISFESEVNYMTREIADQLKIVQQIRTNILSMKSSVEKYIYLQKIQDMEDAFESIRQVDMLLKTNWDVLFINNEVFGKKIQTQIKNYSEKFKNITVRFQAINYQKNRLNEFAQEVIKKFKDNILKTNNNSELLLIITNSLSTFVFSNTEIHRFFINTEKKLFNKSISYLNTIIENMETNDSKMLDSLMFDIEDFRDDFEGTSDIIFVLNKEIQETLLPLAPVILSYSENLSKDYWLQMVNSRNLLDQNANIIKKIMLSIGIMAILIELLFGHFLSKTLITEIKKIEIFTEKIASGDLSEKIENKRNDELGTLQSAINKMVAKFKHIALDVTNTSKTLMDNSKNMAVVSNRLINNSNQVSQNTNFLAESSIQMNNNVNHIASSIHEMSINVNGVSDVSKNISNDIEIVTNAIQNFLNIINSIQKHSEKGESIASQAIEMAGKSELRMNSLIKAANEIGGITKTIKRLAAKTNVIAINANIESASAGEFGKGFAVVANSIQEFAKNNKRAALDINLSISTVQDNIQQVVFFIEEITEIIQLMNKSISSMTQYVNKQAIEFNKIFSNVISVNKGTDEIDHNIKELAVTAQDISKNTHDTARYVNGVDKSIQEIISSFELVHSESKEVLNTSNGLSEISNELSQLIASLKLY